MHKNTFEHSATKETIRAGIANQMLAYATATKKKSLLMASLPGVNWRFETRLLNLLDNSKINLHSVAFEKNEEIFQEASNHWFLSDDDGVSRYGFPSGLMADHTFDYVKGGFQYDYAHWGNAEQVPQAVWADYCGFPSEKELNAFAGWMNKGGEIGYATFSLSVRILDCLPQEIRDKWNAVTEYAERANLVIDYIKTRTKGKLIFSRIYQNEGNRAIMLTIGFIRKPSLPVHRYVKPIIQNDFEGQGPLKGQNKSPSLTPAIIAQVRALVAQGLSIHEVAAQMGKTTMQIAGIKAGAKRLGI